MYIVIRDEIVFLGVLQLTMTVMLKEFVNVKKYFRIQTLNSRISSFSFGPIDASNKPSILNEKWFRPSSDSMMKQSG